MKVIHQLALLEEFDMMKCLIRCFETGNLCNSEPNASSIWTCTHLGPVTLEEYLLEVVVSTISQYSSILHQMAARLR